MNFFEDQDRARASSRRLVIYFVVAVVLTILVIYFCFSGLFNFVHWFFDERWFRMRPGWFLRLARHFGSDGLWNWELFAWVGSLAFSVMTLGCAYKFWQLSDGGAAIAQSLGGRILGLDSNDPSEQRLKNIVEEMAIAAGVAVPDVYIFDDELGINAFAVGNTPSDSVIGVTFGALKLLSREEMQGVIAHEFSHIVNGDTRLNTRLIGWLHGLIGVVILGRILTFNFIRNSDSTHPVAPLFHPAFLPAMVLGGICFVVGSIGAFAARCIKSAVNREREYLADAAAVQFTRNPSGLAGALKKIGGLDRRARLKAARAEEVSHLFFHNGMPQRLFVFTSTHPPLVERIQRLEPDFDGKFKPVSIQKVLNESRITALYRKHDDRPVDFAKLAAVIGPAAAADEMLYIKAASESRPQKSIPSTPLRRTPSLDHLEYATLLLASIPFELRSATSQPFTAVALIYAMVCSKDSQTREVQLREIEPDAEPGVLDEIARLVPLLPDGSSGAYMPLADLCLRALKQMSASQYEKFRSNLGRLFESDRQIDLFEYMLERMIVRNLDCHFRRVEPRLTEYYGLKLLLPDCAVLLSGLAHVAHDSEEDASRAFQCGAEQLGNPDLRLLPAHDCNLPQLDAALNQLTGCSAKLKKRIMEALICVSAVDGVLGRREAELLRAMADALATPIPRCLQPLTCTESIISVQVYSSKSPIGF